MKVKIKQIGSNSLRKFIKQFVSIKECDDCKKGKCSGLEEEIDAIIDEVGEEVRQQVAKEIINYLGNEEKNNNIYRYDADTQNENTIEWIKKRFGVQ